MRGATTLSHSGTRSLYITSGAMFLGLIGVFVLAATGGIVGAVTGAIVGAVLAKSTEADRR